jgi:hypothetical protein
VKVASVIGHTEKNSAWFAKNVVLPQGRYSYFRWTVARSPVVPSPMRYGTLQLGSVWAVSLLTNLASAAKTLPEPNIRPEFQEILSNALHSYLLTSPIAQTWEGAELPFALQENGELEDLCRLEGYVPNEVREHLGELIAFRRHLSDPGQVKAHLDQFLELPAHIQLLVALALRDIEYSTTKYDGMLSEWLEKTKQVSEVLAQAAGEIVDPLVEMLAEFQQHQVSSWHIRLPHLLAYVIEGLKDGARTGVLATHALQLSANAGLGSPIQRLANSRTWAEWASALGTWRANLQDMASRSEPWVASRVRSISATVSRLIGPDARHIVPAETEDAEKAPGS